MTERVILITGSSSGLGKRCAQIMADEQWTVILNSRHHDDKLEQCYTELWERGVNVHRIVADVSTLQGVQLLIQQSLKYAGRIDALIHAVGPFIRERKQFVDYQLGEIEQLVQGNFLSSVWLAHTVLPHMRKQRWGRLVFFGFGRAAEAPAWPDRSLYAATKTGLVSLVKTLAVEEAQFGITVNMVCPGDIVNERKEMKIADVKHLQDGETPRGRPGCGEDVSRVVSFLMRDASDFLTGNMIQVTGGLDVIHPFSKAHKS